jgi:hypothetical protein
MSRSEFIMLLDAAAAVLPLTAHQAYSPCALLNSTRASSCKIRI